MLGFGFVIWMVMLFFVGAAVGSFLNVCIHRLPFEKSILWPLGSRCGSCYQPIRLVDNLPLISYWRLRGKCRNCGAKFSMRYFLVEVLTGLLFAGLFYLEVVANVYHFNLFKDQDFYIRAGVIPFQAWCLFSYHALLLSFLLVASFVDLEHFEIPLPVMITGTIVGLIGSACFPWPWPYTPDEIAGRPNPVGIFGVLPRTGLQLWPIWYPLPHWLPAGAWWTGLATGLAGWLTGLLLLRGVRFVFGLGRGKEGLGIGDADLMMMAGAFLGWQAIVVAFFVSVAPALVMGVMQLISRGNQEMPFGPSLAIGILLTLFGWHWIAPTVQFYFFNPWLLGIVTLGGGFVLLFASWIIRLVRQ